MNGLSGLHPEPHGRVISQHRNTLNQQTSHRPNNGNLLQLLDPWHGSPRRCRLRHPLLRDGRLWAVPHTAMGLEHRQQAGMGADGGSGLSDHAGHLVLERLPNGSSASGADGTVPAPLLPAQLRLPPADDGQEPDACHHHAVGRHVQRHQWHHAGRRPLLVPQGSLRSWMELPDRRHSHLRPGCLLHRNGHQPAFRPRHPSPAQAWRHASLPAPERHVPLCDLCQLSGRNHRVDRLRHRRRLYGSMGVRMVDSSQPRPARARYI